MGRATINNRTQVTTFRPKHSKPKSAAIVLESTLKHLRLDKKIKQYQNFEYWPEVVGEQIAAIAYPEKIMGNKILVVRVIDAAWIQELTFMKTEFLEKLRAVCKNVYFEDIRFLSGNPRQFKDK